MAAYLDTLTSNPYVATAVAFGGRVLFEQTDKAIAFVAVAILAKQCFQQIRDLWKVDIEIEPAKAKVAAVTRQVQDMENDGTTPKTEEKDGKQVPVMKTEVVEAEKPATNPVIVTWANATYVQIAKSILKPVAGVALSLSALAVVVLK